MNPAEVEKRATVFAVNRCRRISSVLSLIAVNAAFLACGSGVLPAANPAPPSGESSPPNTEALAAKGLVCSEPGAASRHEPAASLAGAFEGKFKVGVAMDWRTLLDEDSGGRDVVATLYNRLTSENSMKWEAIEPEEGKFDFEKADALLKFATEHNMEVHGHTLLWHQQTPDWVFKGPGGKDATRQLLLTRLEAHMKGLAEHFKGQVAYWDVVNEAFEDDGAVRMSSPWRRIIGEDFLERAFALANQYFPKAKLGYNDYSMTKPGKLAAVVKLVSQLRAAGLRIDSVGMQAHYRLESPSLLDIETTIQTLAAADVEVLATELDVDVLPRKGSGANLDEKGEGGDPYADCLPVKISKQLNERWTSIFSLYEKHHEAISSVTFWGVSDAKSWRNDFPVRGRTNYALLLDRELRPKKAWKAIVELGAGTSKAP